MRKVESPPNPTAKKTETLAYGGGQRFGPCYKTVVINWVFH